MSIIFERDVQMSVFSDSKGVWGSVVSLKSLKEKWLLIYITCHRQSYSTGELRSFYCIDTSYNPADASTKGVLAYAPCPALFLIQATGRIAHKVLFSLAYEQLCSRLDLFIPL